MTEKIENAMRRDEWRSLLQQGGELEGGDEDLRYLARINLKLCRCLAAAAFDAKGHLDFFTIDQMIEALERNLYCLTQAMQLDTLRRKHALKILRLLKEPLIAKRVHSLAFGLYNRAAEKLVQQTLLTAQDESARPTDHQARIAVICAWMTYLRQNVGSCFATAPAIAIQGHHHDRFLDDMHQLLQVGMLTRSVNGKKISVPLLTHWGSGDLWRPLCLDVALVHRAEFINALIAAKIFDESARSSGQPATQFAKDFIACWLKGQLSTVLQNKMAPWSAGRILRDLLLFHFELSEAQYQRWELSSRSLERHALETSGILVQPSRSKDIASRCLQLRDAEERAQWAFKATTDNALLRAWEYSLASFSESRADFQQWNLSISIGMQGEPDGLSARLNELINGEIKTCNEQIKEAQERADQIRPQLIYIQSKLQNANSEQDLQWGRAEYHQIKGELDRWEESSRTWFRKGEKLAILAQWFVEKCIEGFREQFQEVYDPDLRFSEIQAAGEEVTDDTPAGFRLIAKEGRSLATSWIRIQNQDHFIEILCRFFTDIETQFRTWPEVTEIEREFGQIITRIIHFVRGESFLKDALNRLLNRSHLPKERMPPTPWAYISGGNLGDLLHQYCSLEAAPTSRAKWFDDVRDLWVYLIDEVQSTSVKIQEFFLTDPEYPLLMSSPDHAFNLKPGLAPFCQSWQQRGYPYSWIRDNFEVPVRKFYGDIWLTFEQQAHLISSLQRSIAINIPEQIACNPTCRIAELHSRLANSLLHHPLAKTLLATFESLLFRSLPLMDTSAIGSNMRAVFERAGQLLPQRDEVVQASCNRLQEIGFDLLKGQSGQNGTEDPFVPASDFWDLLLKHWQSGFTSARDDLELLQRAAQDLGHLAPAPVEFADSNWMRDGFAFAINPATLALEIWCVERWGQRGRAMTSWRPWFDRSHSDRKWAVYPQTGQREFFHSQPS